MRFLTVLCSGLLLVGCGDSQERARLEQELAETERRASELQEKLTDTRDTLTTRIAVLEADLATRENDAQSVATDYRQRLGLKDERIAALEKALREQKAIARLLRESAQPTAATSQAEREPAPPRFPLEIRDVEGGQVVVSTRTRKRPVETEETYRDAYGNKQPVIEWEEVDVNEYAYLVRFSARNLTDDPVTFSVQAGQVSETFTLPAGGMETNLSVRSARGSGLIVRVAGQSRRHDVSYLP